MSIPLPVIAAVAGQQQRRFVGTPTSAVATAAAQPIVMRPSALRKTLGSPVPLGTGKTTRILAKFHFTNRQHVPEGIPQKLRPADHVMDKKHAEAAASAGRAELGELGRVRADRVDTGECVVKDAPVTQAGFLRRGLANVGFHLTDIHWFVRRRGPKTQYVVVCSFAQGGEILELSAAQQSALRKLATTRWICNVWQNPDGSSTVNFVHLSLENARHAVVVSKHHLCVVPVTRDVTEGEE